MKYPVPADMGQIVGLTLADGSILNITAANDRACETVSALAKVMQLQPLENRTQNKSGYHIRRRLIVRVEDHKKDSTQICPTDHLTFEDEDIICTLISIENKEMPVLPLVQLSTVICQHAHYHGGVLLHGALAAWNGNGVILAGPGGSGKTTASKKLPNHWQSLCDDTTLVIGDNKGVYWAHPWPTWSTFMFNGPGGTWDVEHAVPLKGIFFLEQTHADEIEPLGIAQSVCLLNESAEQAQCLISSHLKKDELRGFRLLRFDNICALAKTVSFYVLRLSRNGRFWEEIEQALNA